MQEDIIIPIRIIKRKKAGQTYISHSENYYVVTPLSKLLAKAYAIEKRQRENPGLLFKEFCKLNNISSQYLSDVLQLNNLSPKIKKLIMERYLPKHLSSQDIITGNVTMLWKEREEWLLHETSRQHIHIVKE